MSDGKTTAALALRLLFRPVARILLRAGINWKEVAEICKATYVEVATEDFGIRGRPTNVSRVAILTGLTRREVGRLRRQLSTEDGGPMNRMNYATRVLSGWYQDDAFCDASGEPRPLPANGSNDSFEALCKKYSPDVPGTTMLKELKHVGAVTETDDGMLQAQSRYYMPVLMDPEQMLRSGGVVQDLGYTVAYNLHRAENDPSRFERRATNTRMSEQAVPKFRKFIEDEGQAFLERIDAWLSDNESNDDEAGQVRLGFGTYWIEQSKER